MRKVIVIIVLGLAAAVAVAGCKGSSGNAAAEASSGQAAIASVTADPTVQAEIAQGKALVKACFPASPLAQAHTVHLVFFSSASGKHGADVTAARTRLFGCLGIPDSQRDAFKNAAITAAEHQQPKIASRHPAAGVRAYLTVTLPQLVLKYKNASGPSASPSPSGAAS